MNRYGLIFYIKSLRDIPDVKKKFDKDAIRKNEILHRTNQFLISSKKFYDYLGYRGLLHYRLQLKKIDDCVFYKGDDSLFPDDRVATSTDDVVEYSDILSVSDLESEKMSTIIRSFQRISWAFGMDANLKEIDSILI